MCNAIHQEFTTDLVRRKIMSTLIISISAMCCPAEGGPVEQVLRAAPGVADVTLDYSTRTARVTGAQDLGRSPA